jgi:hypothetical protein
MKRLGISPIPRFNPDPKEEGVGVGTFVLGALIVLPVMVGLMRWGMAAVAAMSGTELLLCCILFCLWGDKK